MEEYFRATVLGIIQGLTEFLPISSSAHLRIYPELFGWGDPGAAFTAVIQIGTEVAVLLFFWRDILRIALAWLRSLFKPEWRGHADARMGWYVIIGSIPIVILGVLLKDKIETDFRSLYLIGTTLIVGGIILGIADKVGGTDKGEDKIVLQTSLWMGFAQALALLPGVSRSGATISMGRFLGFNREAGTRFAFLLAIPAVIGAGLFELKSLLACQPGSTATECVNSYAAGPTLVATIVSFIVGFASIAWLLRYVTTKSYKPFVIYRIVLGSATIILTAVGVLSATP